MDTGNGKAKRTGRLMALILTLVFAFTPSLSFAADMKPKIAFFMFVALDMESMSLMDSIPSLLTMSISKTGHFEIIERKKIEREVELEGFKLGSIKASEVCSVGEKLGFDFGVTGDVRKQRGTITANIRVFDVRSQRVFLEHTVTTSEGGLNDKIGEAAAMIIERTRQPASVGAVEGRKYDAAVIPPQDLRVKTGAKKIRITWNYADMMNASGFKVYRALSEEGPYMILGTVTEMFFADEDPVTDGPAFYKITAMNKQGIEGGFSVAVEARTVAGPPPPIFLSAEPDIKSAHLKWRARPGCEVPVFKVYRKGPSEMNFKELLSVQSETMSYTDSGLRDDAAYQYAITTVDARGVESEMSQVLDIWTLKPPPGLKAESGKIRRIALGWNVYPAETAEGYAIYRAADKNSEYRPITKIRDKGTTSYVDKEGLGDALTYWYRISVFNKNGAETDMSEPVSAVTRGVPHAPSGLSAKDREPRRVSLRWDAPRSPEDEISGYYIFRAAEEKGEYKKIAGKSDPETNSYIDNDQPLKDNTTYYYKIASYNSAGAVGNLSGSVSATTKNTPAVPSGLKATGGEVKQVTLMWEANTEKDIKEYVVFRAAGGDRDFSKVASVRGRTGHTDTGLKDGMKYSYVVQAVDEDGLFSEFSAPVTAETKPLPARPAGLKTMDGAGKKILQWQPNPEKDVRQYNVYKKGFLGMSQKIVTVQDVSWSITDDLKGKIEMFVTALDNAGLESEPSDIVEIVIEKK
ncbi:MAG: fibronectin type III domain-containing protein [Deltaproteobacteria bacterium]|nr:fibronectin type III domain-containing protein [Deltaproteobacteria bacterium]